MATAPPIYFLKELKLIELNENDQEMLNLPQKLVPRQYIMCEESTMTLKDADPERIHDIAYKVLPNTYLKELGSVHMSSYM